MTTTGPELGGLLLPVLTDEIVEDIATSAVKQFLDSIDPTELEARSLAQLGGLEGVETVGEAMLATLREMAE